MSTQLKFFFFFSSRRRHTRLTCDWSSDVCSSDLGLELPRHLSHFTPETLGAVVARAGGQVVWSWHQAKPRYYLWSLGFWLRDHGLGSLARLAEWRPIYGVLKLVLEVTLPLARWVGLGEV